MGAFTRFARQRPLLVVGLGVGLGMLLGGLLPWNSIDEQFLGGEAEKLKDDALELASDGYDKVKSAAQSTYDTAAETLRGGTDGHGEASLPNGDESEMYGVARS